jgi:glycerol kinase
VRVAAVDQGTTSTRVLEVGEGEARLVYSKEHAQHYPKKNWVVHDAEELIANIQSGLKNVGDVDAIGIDNQGESCLAWDAQTKKPISPIIVWQDSRTQTDVERLAADGVGPTVYERSGLTLDAYFSASKLAWILSNVPEARKLRRSNRLRMGTTDAFFLDRLTDNFSTDPSTAGRTSLMNIFTGQWDPELCDIFGVPIEVLPEIRPTAGYFGSVTIGPREVPIMASVVDQTAALFGHGCRHIGDAKITFGTGAFALALTSESATPALQEGLLKIVAWRIGSEAQAYALDGGVYNAGSALDWVRRLGLFRDFAEINAFQRPPAVERGIVFVPALSGLACPHWDRSAAGLWHGLSLETTREDMIQSVLEGVAFRTAEVVAALANHVPLGKSISIDGGMSKNPYFCQFLANIMDRAVVVSSVGEQTAVGCAQLAGAEELARSVQTTYRPIDCNRDAWFRLFSRGIRHVKDRGESTSRQGVHEITQSPPSARSKSR